MPLNFPCHVYTYLLFPEGVDAKLNYIEESMLNASASAHIDRSMVADAQDDLYHTQIQALISKRRQELDAQKRKTVCKEI